jgi:hypothetical protein
MIKLSATVGWFAKRQAKRPELLFAFAQQLHRPTTSIDPYSLIIGIA